MERSNIDTVAIVTMVSLCNWMVGNISLNLTPFRSHAKYFVDSRVGASLINRIGRR